MKAYKLSIHVLFVGTEIANGNCLRYIYKELSIAILQAETILVLENNERKSHFYEDDDDYELVENKEPDNRWAEFYGTIIKEWRTGNKYEYSYIRIIEYDLI